MDQNERIQEFVEFFKALADEKRLKIIGLLAVQPYTVEQLAAALQLGSPTVSHHLSYLAHIGLVSARAKGYYNVYQLEPGVLEEMAKRLLSKDELPALAGDVDREALDAGTLFDRKTVKDFTTPDGRIKNFPSQQKKLLAILRYVLQAFEPDRRYTEKEVNEVLGRFNKDTATLRRELIDFKYMARESGVYWRIDQGPKAGE